MNDVKKQTVLFTLWVFVFFNMIYADILGMIRPGYVEMLDQLGRDLSAGTVLFFAVMMEITIVMIPLSRLLGRKANRCLHFVAVPLVIAWVIVPSLIPNLGGETPLSYIFFATIEVTTMLGMLWYVWNWQAEDYLSSGLLKSAH